MQRTLLSAGLAISAALLAAHIVLAQTETKKPSAEQRRTASGESRQKAEVGATTKTATATTDRSADEETVRGNIAAFVKSFNAKDAKAVAELFAVDGQIVTEDGDTVEGRDAIEQGFEDVFSREPQSKMEVFVDAIRFIGSDLAVEIGLTKETAMPGETPEYGRYTVLHVKRDGQWLMALARDTTGEPPTHHEHLQPLAWLVGEWIDDGGNSVVHTSCRWSDDKNFLLQDMNLQIAGRDAMHVTQRIGWDPLNKRIRSWVFDTEGGFGEGVWARDGDLWVIKSTGVRPDGMTASATSEIVPTGTDGYVWRVRDRVSGDDVAPPLEVKVVRKPPQPAK